MSHIDEFKGIVESNDLFFVFSEKGNRHLERKPKQRGKKASKAGISDEQVTAIALLIGQGTKTSRWLQRDVSAKKI